jgi:peptidoglycan/xylan/chitin deacetylase (PgdA/CDA1 family)
MESNKPLFFTQRILITLLCLTGTLGIGFLILIKPNSLKAENNQSIDNSEITATVGIQKQLERLKAMMLTTWQQEVQAKGISTDVPSRFRGVTIEKGSLSSSEKVIALTFDDGPWPESTAHILDILKKNHIKGTFFVVGQNVKNYPDLTKRTITEGHAIGNHTWHHWYHYLNPQAATYEIVSTTDIIYKTTGVKTGLFRPPGGIMGNGVAAYARNNDYALILWSSDSVDYSHPSVSRLIGNIFREAAPGGIVLMHDGGGDRSHTVAALPEIIRKFRKQGYQFVTIPELLEMQDHKQSLTAKKK